MNRAARPQIVRLPRDRPDYLREALRSALSQTGERIEVKVSDDSERDEVARLLAAEFPEVPCIRRSPPLGGFDHFRAVIDGATAALVMMVHDDDVLMEGYAPTLRGRLEADPSLATVCGNAAIQRGTRITAELFAPGRDTTLRRPEDLLLLAYFPLSLKGLAPFPGYVYRHDAIEGLRVDPRHGGKYSDVSFLLKVLRRGAVLWLGEAWMRDRLQGQNDSGTETVGQRHRLLRNVYGSTADARRSPLVSQYSNRYWTSWWRGAGAAADQPEQRPLVHRFLIGSTITYALTQAALWQDNFAKLGRLRRERAA